MQHLVPLMAQALSLREQPTSQDSNSVLLLGLDQRGPVLEARVQCMHRGALLVLVLQHSRTLDAVVNQLQQAMPSDVQLGTQAVGRHQVDGLLSACASMKAQLTQPHTALKDVQTDWAVAATYALATHP
eukprot:TRINITY_DN4318_c0_g1_i1.p1 TRINITY_DN4318_c0_g1~~TRINITY_DN4318_c0_g1_i1.p1  ORF type:complete len:129 (-),score=42.46 TRINITY_DN4318_c0_g1_i1:74-460(-)